MNKDQKSLIQDCISELNLQIDFFEENKSSFMSPGKTWSDRTNKMLNQLKANKDILKNFKRSNIFNSDVPAGNMNWFKETLFKFFSLLPKFIKYHPYVNLCEDSYQVIKEEGAINILKNNPISFIGNPIVYKKNRFTFTCRWLRHILIIHYYQKIFSQITDVNIVADIGTGYGTFPILMKKNYNKKKFILIDLPEQLCAAHYYIKSEFPDAKIPTFDQIINSKRLDRDFFEKFDFSLIPCYFIDKIEKNSSDLITNFASFNEMPKEWFDKYMESDLLQGSKYIYTMNRITRAPLNSNDSYEISILDMSFENYEKIFFDVFKLNKWKYITVKLFNLPIYAKKNWHDPKYIFAGKKKIGHSS